MKTLILIPAYGARYVTEGAVINAWNVGHDFEIRTIGVRGTYASKRDMDEITKHFDQVYIRYNDDQDIAIVYQKAETVES